jgi:hypothetical protein
LKADTDRSGGVAAPADAEVGAGTRPRRSTSADSPARTCGARQALASPPLRVLGLRFGGRVRLAHGVRGRAPGRGMGAISTRRLSARPAASALEATGCSAPKAAAKTA